MKDKKRNNKNEVNKNYETLSAVQNKRKMLDLEKFLNSSEEKV